MGELAAYAAVVVAASIAFHLVVKHPFPASFLAATYSSVLNILEETTRTAREHPATFGIGPDDWLFWFPLLFVVGFVVAFPIALGVGLGISALRRRHARGEAPAATRHMPERRDSSSNPYSAPRGETRARSSRNCDLRRNRFEWATLVGTYSVWCVVCFHWYWTVLFDSPVGPLPVNVFGVSRSMAILGSSLIPIYASLTMHWGLLVASLPLLAVVGAEAILMFFLYGG